MEYLFVARSDLPYNNNTSDPTKFCQQYIDEKECASILDLLLHDLVRGYFVIQSSEVALLL